MDGEPLDEVQWRAPEWVQAFGGLRNDNVLEYFAQSPFYDRSSNNQVLKMQSQFNENLHGRHDLYQELQNMKGVEFVVALDREPEMWIIRKQNRLSPQEVRLLATYFVINENIFMAPSIYSVVSSRLLSTAHSLSKLLIKAATLPTYSPSQGYSYITESSLSVSEDSPTPAASINNSNPRVKGRTPAPETNYSSPMASLTPGGPPTAIGSNVPGDDRAADRAIERALLFTLHNSSLYLDGDNNINNSVSTEAATQLGTTADVKAKAAANQRRRRKTITAND
ncbi:Med6p [Sugiyamaella lignohabitans]|uniref:Mediator of RNA polymerase II transcription subunit 6 n=1 Tax=Sugiyamaella lignohabitans TaxID=796027 RepID=A0A167DWC9_9ASCO|nr:Med6p [Sugiyamaella lignohabitans]ANB13373.1 Med6p [Sugiyamaella lignohabitans]